MMVSSHVPTPLLCCPECGRSRRLNTASDLPAGLIRLFASCPECAEHGRGQTRFQFASSGIVDSSVAEASLALPLPLLPPRQTNSGKSGTAPHG